MPIMFERDALEIGKKYFGNVLKHVNRVKPRFVLNNECNYLNETRTVEKRIIVVMKVRG